MGGGVIFQLHHTGIKTHYFDRSNKDRDLFQLHHTGIKTGSYSVGAPCLIISIAPYRN